MYKCYDCGEAFEEPATREESRGEYWGTPCTETVSGCPKCHGDYEEAVECSRCGEWCFEDELDDGLCEDCQAELND